METVGSDVEKADESRLGEEKTGALDGTGRSSAKDSALDRGSMRMSISECSHPLALELMS
jgi:hypothetical protein